MGCQRRCGAGVTLNNSASGIGGFLNGIQIHMIGVGKTGFFRKGGSYTNTTSKIKTGVFNHSIFQAPGFIDGLLKVQIRIICTPVLQTFYHPIQLAFIQTRRLP